MIGRLFVLAIFSTVPLHVSFAQKLVDPDKHAPEYRAAAEKRRAEQIKVADCSHKASTKRLLHRFESIALRRSGYHDVNLTAPTSAAIVTKIPTRGGTSGQ